MAVGSHLGRKRFIWADETETKKNWWTYLELLTGLVILGIDCQINTIFFLEILSRKFEIYRCGIKVVQLILMRSPEIIVLTLTRENEILLILPVEVGSLSHLLHIFTRFYTSKRWLALGFLNHQELCPICVWEASTHGCLVRLYWWFMVLYFPRTPLWMKMGICLWRVNQPTITTNHQI